MTSCCLNKRRDGGVCDEGKETVKKVFRFLALAHELEDEYLEPKAYLLAA
jgi:hypothetical protein